MASDFEASGQLDSQVRYPIRFPKIHGLNAVRAMSDGMEVSTAARVLLRRQMGQLTFVTIGDAEGKIQLSIEAESFANYEALIASFGLGDIVGVKGTLYHTRRGELTIRASDFQLLSKAIRPLPEKWKGVVDAEIKARQRYLDTITSDESKDRFIKRSAIISAFRRFLGDAGFLEVETPILQMEASGAMAKPFKTHHNALGIDLYLRIAPETFLKRVVAGGFDRVFELGRNFRNEGISPSHLQEFTMLEFYAAYWDYRDNMAFVQSLLQHVVTVAFGDLAFESRGQKFDFSGEWEEVEFIDLIKRETSLDLAEVGYELDALQAACSRLLPDFDTKAYVSSATLIDSLYKRYCRPKIVGPTFLIHHPSPLIPLARKTDADPSKLAMFQVLVNGVELVKAYSELVDPIEQRSRLEEQQVLAGRGEEETMMLEEDFLVAMEHGMPPMSGVGVGIDRLIMLLTGAANIRDTVFFPSMRPAGN